MGFYYLHCLDCLEHNEKWVEVYSRTYFLWKNKIGLMSNKLNKYKIHHLESTKKLSLYVT